jgi:hypothetical protein
MAGLINHAMLLFASLKCFLLNLLVSFRHYNADWGNQDAETDEN